MISILASGHQFLPRLVPGKKAEAATKIPAARALAEIAAKRGHVANLRTGGVVERLRQCGIVLDHIHIVSQFAQRGESADAKSLRRRP